MKKIAMVDMTFYVIMALCVIGLCGCSIIDASTRQNAKNSGSGNIEQNQSATGNSNSANTPITGNTVELELDPVSLAGWYAWPRDTNILTVNASGNGCTISSRGRMPDSEGIVNEHLGTFLRGRTLVLRFSNTRASSFQDGRMIKVEADNTVILPPASMFPVDGFLPAGDTPPNRGVEYRIPNTFNGKLNFVFYQAELNDLKITAYYK